MHILYRLTWCGTVSDVNREVNNGRGPVDFKASRGTFDKSLIEFKLASNTQLRRNLQNQVEIYLKANLDFVQSLWPVPGARMALGCLQIIVVERCYVRHACTADAGSFIPRISAHMRKTSRRSRNTGFSGNSAGRRLDKVELMIRTVP
jgi:hypothetical protein